MSKRANWPMCAPRSSPRCADPCTPASPACVDRRSLPLLSFGIQDCNSKMFITLFHETHSKSVSIPADWVWHIPLCPEVIRRSPGNIGCALLRQGLDERAVRAPAACTLDDGL